LIGNGCLFWSEMQESYYCPPVGKHRNASGKLPDKIKNIKYQVKKRAAGSWTTSHSKSSSVSSEDQIIQSVKFAGNNYKTYCSLERFH